MREKSRPVPSEGQTPRSGSRETISPEHAKQEHKGPFVGDLQETARHLEIALDNLTEKQGKMHDADAPLQRAAGIYALYFEGGSNFQEDLRMFRDALRASRARVSSEEILRVTKTLREWIKDADKSLLGVDHFDEKYDADRE